MHMLERDGREVRLELSWRDGWVDGCNHWMRVFFGAIDGFAFEQLLSLYV